MKEALEILKNNKERKTAGGYIRIKQKCIVALEDYLRTHEIYCYPDEDKLFERVEAALGFKLYAWQKAYIISGIFRRTGRTTAECLKILLDVNEKPLDLSQRAVNPREDCERRQLREIQIKLKEAGIKTRIIFWNKWEKNRYFVINEHLEEAKQIAKTFPCFSVMETEGKE